MPPTISLQPGSTNTQAVKQLQDWLVSNGYMTQAQVNTGYGIYGPQTTAAVAKAQQSMGVDNSTGVGYWGPRTISAVSQQPTQQNNVNPNANYFQSQPKTQAQVDAEYATAAAAHPVLATNTPEMLNYAISSGDLSSLVNSTGKPFSVSDQNAAVSQATGDVSEAYRQGQVKDTQDTEDVLAEKKRNYEAWLETQGQNFQTEKTQQDQDAANRGVLFSGGRAQKLKQLEQNYTRAGEQKKLSVASDIGTTARDFGYKYGDTAVGGLNSFFNLGGNTYNANVASGGVGSTGLSSIYNGNQGFYGTQNKTKNMDIQKRAAGLLYNKGNKLLSTGYTNQY